MEIEELFKNSYEWVNLNIDKYDFDFLYVDNTEHELVIEYIGNKVAIFALENDKHHKYIINVVNFLNTYIKDLLMHKKILKEIKKHHKADILLKLIESETDFKLVGGAVYDILIRNILPKDLDFSGYYIAKTIKKNGYAFMYETYNSTTYENKDSIKIQQLKKDPETFDFEIAKCSIEFITNEYNKYSNTLPTMHAKLLTTDIFDYIDEKGLTLIPCSWEKENIKNSISRVIHWINKGCNMSNETYHSMCNIVFDTNNNNKFNGS
jgi:hypothetical protein